MAPKQPRKSSSEQKSVYLCCKTTELKTKICIGCGKAYHTSCAVRDWTKKMKILDNTRVLCDKCCDDYMSSNCDLQSDNISDILHRIIIREFSEKNNLLMKIIKLYEEKFEKVDEGEDFLKETISKQCNLLTPITVMNDRKLSAVSDKMSPKAAHMQLACVSSAANLRKKEKQCEVILAQKINCPPSQDQNSKLLHIKEKKNSIVFPEDSNLSSASLINNNDEVFQNEEIKQVANEQDKPENEKWELVQRRKIKQRPQHLYQQRPTPIKGSKNSTGLLKAADEKTWLFLSGLDPSTKKDQIIQYLKENGVENADEAVYCEKMKTKRDKTRSSFRLGVPKSERERIMAENFWTHGIIINHFINLQNLRPSGYREQNRTQQSKNQQL